MIACYWCQVRWTVEQFLLLLFHCYSTVQHMDEHFINPLDILKLSKNVISVGYTNKWMFSMAHYRFSQQTNLEKLSDYV